MFVEMQNNIHVDGAVVPPKKEDGSLYRYCMYFDNNQSVIFSDFPSELIERLIAGYKSLEFKDQKEERHKFLLQVNKTFGSNTTILDFDSPDDLGSLGYGSEESFLRSLHKINFISLFSS